MLYRLQGGGLPGVSGRRLRARPAARPSSRRISTSPPTRCRRRCAPVPQLAAWSGGASAWRTCSSAARSSRWRPSAPPARRRRGKSRCREADPEEGEAPELDEESRARMSRSARAGRTASITSACSIRTAGCLRDNVYGTHRRGRLAARFHGQRALLQHRRLLDLGLRRRCRGHRRAAPAPDRRSGDALSRGSGAHAARRALRGEARLHARPGDRRADRARCASCWPACRRRACSTRR